MPDDHLPEQHLAPVTYLFGTESAAPNVAGSADFNLALDSADNELDPAIDPASITKSSTHALARRGMSVREMRDYLSARGYDEHTVEHEVERLQRVGLLDDADLAEALVLSLRQRKGLGRSGLSAELRRRKLDTAAIDAALGELSEDELLRAIEVASKRASQLSGLEPETARRRLAAFLMRRGYSGSTVSTAVDRALARGGTPTFR